LIGITASVADPDGCPTNTPNRADACRRSTTTTRSATITAVCDVRAVIKSTRTTATAAIGVIVATSAARASGSTIGATTTTTGSRPAWAARCGCPQAAGAARSRKTTTARGTGCYRRGIAADGATAVAATATTTVRSNTGARATSIAHAIGAAGTTTTADRCTITRRAERACATGMGRVANARRGRPTAIGKQRRWRGEPSIATRGAIRRARDAKRERNWRQRDEGNAILARPSTGTTGIERGDILARLSGAPYVNLCCACRWGRE
jgi:hypothetical protein